MPQITVTTTIKTVFEVPEGVDIHRVRHLALPELAEDDEKTDEVGFQQEKAINHVYLGAANPMKSSVEISITDGWANLAVTAPDLLADLQLAAAQLRKYETLHRAKDTLESLAKAEVNADLATRFERTIAKATA